MLSPRPNENKGSLGAIVGQFHQELPRKLAANVPMAFASRSFAALVVLRLAYHRSRNDAKHYPEMR
jgi:hypothetical protein